MKNALVVALVVVLALAGLPILMSMPGMATCSDCGPALYAGGLGCTLAVLMAAAAIALSAGRLPRRHAAVLRLRLHAVSIDRPPRLA